MHALIIANGVLPSRSAVRSLVKKADRIVCADGGANGARKLGVQPDVILGDLDSIAASTKRFFHAVPLVLREEQDSTDTEKAIWYCIQQRMRSVDVIGAAGGRIDHTTGNLGCFKKFGDRVRLRFIDSFGALVQVRGSIRFTAKVGERLSLIPLERCTGVTTLNLKYSLHNELLELGVREGISNEVVGRSVKIAVKRGTLLLYRFHHGNIF